MQDSEPDYSRYETHELEDAARNINRASFPERAQRLDDELARRRPARPRPAAPVTVLRTSDDGERRVLRACLFAPWVFFLVYGVVLLAAPGGAASTIQVFGVLGAIAVAIVCPIVITQQEPPDSVGGLVLLWIGFPLYVALSGMVAMAVWFAVAMAMGATPR